MTNPLRKLVYGLACAALISGCAGPDKPAPAELAPNVALLGVRTAWTANVGSVRFPLQVGVAAGNLYVASSEGSVAAINANTGADVWRANIDKPISAGVGTDGHYAAVVTKDNELVTLEAGKVLWRKNLTAVTLTAPLVAGNRIFALTSDRTVIAFDAATGRQLWRQTRTGDSLVLGRAGLITAVGDTLVAGIGGRLVGMNPLNGNTRWEATLATSRGTNEVERLVDLVSGFSRTGEQVCVRAFQSAVGCVDSLRGAVLWSKPASGYTGVGGDDTLVLGTEGDGKLQAWRRTDGERLWTTERLRFRSLSEPLLVGRSVVVGDGFGLLHFLSKQNGEPLTRLSTDGSAIVAAPILLGQTVIAVTQRGGIFGFRPE